ncbi:MAG: hypothetical protein QOJ90_2945 [Actinomycetota bacterium]|nr:hypothetical protein [Actinomycetota bacterium]
MRHRGSIRTRTTVLASAVVALTFITGAVILVLSLQRSLTRSDDELAKARSHDLAAMAADGILPRVLTDSSENGVAQVVDASGHVLAASPNILGKGPISSFRPAGPTPVVRTVDNAPDDNERENYRVWALRATAAHGPVTVYVGNSLESVNEASRTLRRSLLLGVPVMLALLAFATWLVIGRALRPVEDIRAEVASISEKGLSRRVPVPDVDDEVSRLATTMNQMLARLESSSRQQRAFVADASHELQSPLAAFRAQLEVALADPSRPDLRAVMTDVLAESDQMERIVRDLLFLARADSSAEPREHEPLDLDDIVLQEAVRARALGTIALDTSDVSGAPVRGSRDELRRLVRNLVENATRHARTSVRLAVSTDESFSRLDVCDDGPGVPPDQRSRVFDRFHRVDPARSRDGGGTGLGLAIARAITERHGGSLDIADSETGAHFVLLLPTTEPARGADAHRST